MGERLRAARSGVNMTQDAAAASLGMARTTLVAIEKGQRRVKPDETLALARLYGVSVGKLMSPDAIHVDLAATFRRTGGRDSSEAVTRALALLDRLVSGAVQLERLLGREARTDYPPPVRIVPQRVAQQADDAAERLRARLGLGLGPVPDLIGGLVLDLGLRFFVRPLRQQISGLFAYDPAVGACMLLNADHHRSRRVQTAAQGAGRFAADRAHAEVLEREGVPLTVEERFAKRFGSALLMPASGVRARFERIIGSEDRFGVRELILLAHQFGVGTEAMSCRLEDLSLLPQGSWAATRSRGSAGGFERDAVGEAGTPPPAVSPRLAYLASSALERELLSEGQVCDLLAIDRLELREALRPFEAEEVASLHA